MHLDYKPSFFTLLLLISFPAVNAVLYTPALPFMAEYFQISNETAQQTIGIFLLGYAFGQLVYGPIANRFGRIWAIYVGITIQILSSLACILTAYLHSVEWFFLARFLVAIGSGVGLKITFTLVNEYYTPQIASQKITHLSIAFAIAPGLAVATGGFLTQYLGWISCFYFLALYGVFILFLASRLPETKINLDMSAFKFQYFLKSYLKPFTNPRLVAAGLLMGSYTAIVYVFATLAPFVAISPSKMNSAEFGFYNLLPALGMFAGGLIAAHLVKNMAIIKVITIGMCVMSLGVLYLVLGSILSLPLLWGLFLPGVVMLFGNSFVYGNASTLGLKSTEDKANGSAILNFLNVGFATLAVFSLGLHTASAYWVLPAMCTIIFLLSVVWFLWLKCRPEE